MVEIHMALLGTGLSIQESAPIPLARALLEDTDLLISTGQRPGDRRPISLHRWGR